MSPAFWIVVFSIVVCVIFIATAILDRRDLRRPRPTYTVRMRNINTGQVYNEVVECDDLCKAQTIAISRAAARGVRAACTSYSFDEKA